MMKKGMRKRILAMLLCIGTILQCGACGERDENVGHATVAPTAEIRVEITAEPTKAEVPTDVPMATAIPDLTKAPEPTAATTPEPTKTPMPTATATPTPTNTPEPTATNTPTPVPTKAPTPTVTLEMIAPSESMEGRAPTADTACRYSYSSQFAVQEEGILSEASYLKSESEVYRHILEQVNGRANKYILTFGAASSDIVETAAKRLAKLPGMRSIEVEKKEVWANAAAFSVTVSHVPEFALLYAWTTGDASELSGDGIRLLQKAEELVAEAEQLASTYEIVVFFHDYLVLNTSYDMRESETVGQTAYGALIEGHCVCMGYTNAFHMLLTMAGIDCLIVSGEAGGGAHAWNKVWIDGAWYNVDVTWDDPIPDVPGEVGYAYLCVTDAFLAKSHTWDNTDFPSATATEYNYLQRTVSSFADTASMIQYCKECLAAGDGEASFIYTGATPDLQALVQELQCGISYRNTECQGGVWYRITFEQ